jgi:hypothetical protein
MLQRGKLLVVEIFTNAYYSLHMFSTCHFKFNESALCFPDVPVEVTLSSYRYSSVAQCAARIWTLSIEQVHTRLELLLGQTCIDMFQRTS